MKKKMHRCRTVIAHEYISKKHAFVTSALSRHKISHVGVQVLHYTYPVATAATDSAPERWTFCLLDAADIIYVFKPSDGSNFASVGDGYYSVLSVIQRMFRDVKMKDLVDQYERERGRLKANTQGAEDEEIS